MTRRAALLTALAVLLVSVGSALFLTYPAFLALDHAVVGDWRHPDMISNHWLYRWTAETLLSGDAAGLLHNDRYYFPVGDAPFLAGNGSDAVLHTGVAAVLPWPGSVTAWVLLMVTLNGVGGGVLARSLGARSAGVVAGALVLALSPYVAHELMGMRLSQAPLGWFALFLAAWLHLARAAQPRHGMAVLAGILYALTAFVYWYHGLWAALLGAGIWAARPRVRPLLAFVPTALLLTLPPLALFLSSWSDIPGTGDDLFPHPLARESSLAVSFPLLGGAVERAEVGPGVLVFVLAGLGLGSFSGGSVRARMAAAPRVAWALVAAAAGFGLLALGPELLLPDGTATGIPGPYRLLYSPLGALRRFWWPYRHVAPLTLALVPLIGRGVDLLVDKAKTAPARFGLALAVLAAWPVSLGVARARLDVPTSWWEPPPAYEALGQLPGDVIFELPAAPRLATSQQTLSYQWVHGKTLVNGHAMWVDRVRPDAWDEFVAGNSFLSRLQEYERGQLFGPFAFRPEDVVALREVGVRHLVVNAEYHPRALFPLVQGYRRIFTQLFGEPTFTFRDQLFAWDLERYAFAGKATAPEFRLPPELLEGDGSRMLDLGYNRPQGWRTVALLFPPVIPPAADADGQPGAGPVPQGPGAVAPHGEAPPLR